MVSLATEEALPSIPEEQSATLMIEGLMGALEPELEIAEVLGAEEEEEGSSSTMGNDDHEGMTLKVRTRLMMLMNNKL